MKNFIILIYFTGVGIAALSQNVVQVEYFIDTDAGYGNNNLVSIGPSSDLTFPGYSKFFQSYSGLPQIIFQNQRQ